MKGANLWKIILVIGIILVAAWYLQYSIRYYTMTAEDREENPSLAEKLRERSFKLGLDIQGGLHLVMEIDTTKLPPDLAEPPIDESEAVIRSRVDQFGVSEPTIQKVGNMRLIVDLPGISDLETAKELLQETAQLEFKLVRSVNEVQAAVSSVDRLLAQNPELLEGRPIEKIAEVEQKTETEEAVDEKVDADTSAAEEQKVAEADQQEEADTTAKITAADIFENDSVGTTEPMEGDEMDMEKYPFTMLVMTREGDNTIYVSLSDVDQVEKIIALPEVQNVLPRGTELIWGTRESTFQDGYIYKPLFLLNKEPELTGKYLETADFTLGSSADPRNAGRPLVNLTFNEDGRKIFSRVTGANIKKRLAIVLNGLVYTAPTIQTKITHNTAQITGIQDLEEAKIIAIVLRAGALPAPLNIIEERTVGPSLGQDSVNKGLTATIVGLVIVLLFMIVYYGLSGVIADFAILLNMLFVVAVMTMFRFTLTLPGIAGLILTVGMALDANVLIFSRIREELAQGKTVMAAIDAGYSRAFLTIFDANLTTFITALVLYVFGTGAIQGFALTLMIGIAASMFTAIFVTRLIFDVYTVKAQPKKLSI